MPYTWQYMIAGGRPAAQAATWGLEPAAARQYN